jgi:hypothetical protein
MSEGARWLSGTQRAIPVFFAEGCLVMQNTTGKEKRPFSDFNMKL